MTDGGFTWGNAGEKLTPSDRRRKLAEAMILRGADASPIKHWTQGAARVAEAMLGQWELNKADAADKAGLAEQAGRNALLMGGGSAAPAAAVTPTASTADPSVAVAATPAALAPVFTSKEAEYRLPTNYLPQVAKIESSFNPSAANPNSSARGLFQFTKGTARDYGLTNPMDPIASTDAAARLAADNAKTLTGALGRAPTAGELYLAHQQGGGGASKLLANPNARAVDIVGRDAVINNGGRADMTAGEFAKRWTNKVALNDADMPASDAMQAEAPIAPAGFAVPPGEPAAQAMTGQNFNAIQAGQPLDPVFQSEGVSQPWMGTAIPPQAPMVAQAPAQMPPPRPADLPAPGAVEAVGVMPQPVMSPPQMMPDLSNSPDGGMRQLQVQAEQARQSQPSAPQEALSPFQRVAAAMGGGGQPVASPAAPAPTPSPAVATVAQAVGAPAVAEPPAPASPGTSRVAAAMATLNSPYARPGERAIAQQIVQQAFKDPTETESKRLAVELQRKSLAGDPLDREAKQLEIDAKKRDLKKVEPPVTRDIEVGGVKTTQQWDPQRQIWATPKSDVPAAPPTNPYALPGKPTEVQSKSAGFANRLVEANNIILELENVGLDKKQAALGSVPFFGNALSSSDKQRFEQAKRNFVTASLRPESGAVISDTEFATEEKKYFPQVGDTPAVIEQKRISRENQIKSIVAAAGSGYKVPEAFKPGSKPGAAKQEAAPPPAGVDANVWKHMTPEERALWK